MQVYTLPDFLELNSEAELQLFDYVAPGESEKNMVNLTMNTCSFLLEGVKEVITGNKTVSIDHQDFLMMKSGHLLMTERFAHPCKYRSLLLFFSDKAVLDFCRKHHINLDHQGSNTKVLNFHKDAFLTNLLEGLLELSKMEESMQSKLLPLKFEELMLYLVTTQGAGFLAALLAHTTDQARHFKEVVESNKLNKLSLKELAFLCHMSLSTFKREFEKMYGQSPSRWFQDQRLEYSAFLLKNEAKRASDIFDEVGYENLSNFIHAFKNKYGITPKQYQQG